MGKGGFGVLVAAAVLCALPAGAWAQTTPTDRSTPPPGGWTLTLQGKKTKVLPIDKVPSKAKWDGTKAGNINPQLRYVYEGQLLYKLLGLVDDSKAGFNVAKAKKGYKVKLYCTDGYKPSFSSKILFKKGRLRKDLIIAKIKAGQPLPAAEAPFRFVGGPPVTQPFNCKLSAKLLTKIRLIF
ncbi:MAG TPA: hypothetical protein VMH50_07915 [Thermoleophilia bacterium]|nr:hypothetical protein [Thermoleophilia bacterium]